MVSRFPHETPIAVGNATYTPAEITAALGPLVTPRRRARIAEVVAGRTCTVTPVLEGLYDRGNVSAVLRSAEALGFQTVHIAALQETWREAKRVTQGAQKWLDVWEWDTTAQALEHLRARGYRNYAMVMDDAEPIDAIDLGQPSALWFGSERDGLSPALLDAADARITIPMTGFTRSFNISVAAALALYHARAARDRAGGHGDLAPSERETLEALFYLRCFDEPERLLRERAATVTP